MSHPEVKHYIEQRIPGKVDTNHSKGWARMLIKESEIPDYFCPVVADGTADNFLNINTADTTVVKTGTGILRRIVFNRAVVSQVTTMYDNVTDSGIVIGTITHPVILLRTQLELNYNIKFNVGLTVKTDGLADITVVYR